MGVCHSQDDPALPPCVQEIRQAQRVNSGERQGDARRQSLCTRGLRVQKVRDRGAGRLRRLHQGRAHTRPQRTAHAVLHLLGHGLCPLLRFLHDHHLHGSGLRRRSALGTAHLQLHDALQSHDALHGLCHDNHGWGVNKAYYRGPGRKEHDHEPRKPCLRGCGRLHRLRPRQLPLLRKGGTHGALEH